mgnify:CR=1 FL=1
MWNDLLFIRRLGELATFEKNEANRPQKPMEERRRRHAAMTS